MKELVELEEKILKYKGKTLPMIYCEGEERWFSDRYLAKLLGLSEKRSGIGASLLVWSRAGTCAVSGVENAAYYFSTYNAPDQVKVSNRPRS